MKENTKVPDESQQLLPLLLWREERFESRLTLFEEECKGSIDVTKRHGQQLPDEGTGAS